MKLSMTSLVVIVLLLIGSNAYAPPATISGHVYEGTAVDHVPISGEMGVKMGVRLGLLHFSA